jgi:hypothetical protein
MISALSESALPTLLLMLGGDSRFAEIEEALFAST